jgi:hypothetical protein
MIVALLGTAFVVTRCATELGGWQGSAVSVLWLTPTCAVGALAAVRPRAASWLLHAGLVVLLVTWVVVLLHPDLQPDLLLAVDGYENALAVAGFALGIPAGVIGLHRPRTAAFLLGMIALTPVLAVAVADAVVVDAVVTDQVYELVGLTTPGCVSAAVQLLTAALFLLAWQLGHPSTAPSAAASSAHAAPPAQAASSQQADRAGDGRNRLLKSRS